VLPINATIQAKHGYGTSGIANHMSHCQGTIGFQHSTPTQNDEIALPSKVDDSCAGLPFCDHKPELDLGLCTADRTHPIEKFLRPRRPLMVGLVELARRD